MEKLKIVIKKYWKIYLAALVISAVCDLIGTVKLNIGVGTLTLFPMVFAVIFGGLLGPDIFKVFKTEECKIGGSLVLVVLAPFMAKMGISSGAKLVVALVMVASLGNALRLSSWVMIAAAFVGAMICMGFVILMSGVIEQMAMLIVSGVMIGYICSAVTDFIVTFAEDADIVNLHNWSKGSFSGMTWENVKVMVLVTGIASIGVFLLSKPISAYEMGEAYAANMGLNVKRFRVLLVLLSSVLAACVTAFAGPVSFVGIAVPHLVKWLLGTARPILLIPACFLGGSVFCLFCDLLARTMFSPTELSISTVTAVFGAPVVIYIMIHRRREKAA